jgi:hypothetical protein
MPTISSCASLIVAVQLYKLLRAVVYSGALLRNALLNKTAMPTIHSSRTSLIVAVRLSCTQSAACCGATAVLLHVRAQPSRA